MSILALLRNATANKLQFSCPKTIQSKLVVIYYSSLYLKIVITSLRKQRFRYFCWPENNRNNNLFGFQDKTKNTLPRSDFDSLIISVYHNDHALMFIWTALPCHSLAYLIGTIFGPLTIAIQALEKYFFCGQFWWLKLLNWIY